MNFWILLGVALTLESLLTVRATRITDEAKALVTQFDNDKLQDTLDDIIQDLEDKYGTFDPSDFWHPYVFGTGNENREILHVQNVQQAEVEGDFIQWKYARLGLKHYLIGLEERKINIVGLDFLPVTSVELGQALEAFTVITKWNEEENHAEMIILSVSSEPRLHVHLFVNGRSIHSITSFPLHYAVKAIEPCHVGLSSKVVLIPKDSKMDIDIYNVEVHNNTQVWFFQRLPAKNNSNMVVYDSDTLESIVAVAGDNQLYIHSFDSKAGLFAVSQNISLPNACKTLFSFTVAYQHYIGCVPLDPDYIVRFVSYNYNTNEYILEDEDSSFRDSKTTSAYPIAVPDYTDQYFILVRDVNAVTRIMVYHGRQSGFQVEYNCTTNNSLCPDVPDLSRGVGFRHRDYSGFIFPSGERGGNSIVWLITKEIRDTRSPLLDESRQLYNNYNELSKRFQEWERSVAAIETVLNNSVKTTEPNVLTGSWTVGTINAKKLLGDGKKSQVEALNHLNHLRFVGSEWTEQDFGTDIKHINNQLNYLKKNASVGKAELANAILAENNGTVQYVTAPQRITGKFQAEKLIASKIVTRSFGDDIEPAAFLNSFVLKSYDIRINGGLQFTKLVKITSLNATTINGIPVSNIARYSQENLFECPVQFINGFNVSGSVISPTINGISVVDEVMLASNISGVNFVDGFVISNNTNSKGDYSFDNVLLKSTSQVVQSHIHFEHLRVTSPLEVTNIDHYNLDTFLSSVVTKDYSGLISGRKTAADSIHANRLNIGSTWNNVSFPNGFIRNNQNRVTLNLPTTLSFLTVKKVNLGGRINGVHLNDLVTRDTKQDLNSTWTFSGPVTVNRDIAVSGLVDGVDLKELANKATLNDLRDVHIYADVQFEHNISIDTLQVNNEINGQAFEPIFRDLLQFNGTHCQIPGVTTVLTNITLDTINVGDGSINSQQLSTFFLVNGDQNITEDVTLSESCNFTNLYALKSFDNVDLATLLDNAVRLTGSNTIKWKTAFEHIKCGDGMIINGPINGFSDFGSNVAVTSGRPSQTFLSPIEFDFVNFNSAVVGRDFNVTENQKIGGLDIKKWFSRRISLSKRDYITSPVIIDGLVKTSHDIFTPTINNISLETLSTSALRSGVPEQVFAKHVTFLKGLEVVKGSIKFDNTVSGYDLNHIRQNAFPLNSSDGLTLELNGVWKFESIIVEKELEVLGKTCGVDLKDLESTTVRKNALDIRIPGVSHFQNVVVEKVVHVGSINGRNPDDLLTTHTNQTIHCNFKAKKNVKITGNLVTDGQVNGVSTEMLSKTYSLGKNNTHIINADYKFNHNLTTERLIVRGTIQGKDFSNTANNRHLIKVNDVGLKFTGSKTFTSAVIISKDSDVKVYNGLPIETLSFQTLDQDIIVPAATTFHGSVYAKTVQLNQGSHINAETVMGHKWEDILANSIPLDLGEGVDPEHLRHLIFDSVIVDRHLNTKSFQGHRFEDFIRLDSDQNMGELKVKKVKITGTTLTVGGLVNGLNIEEEFERTIMKDDSLENLELSGNKTFLGTIIVEGEVSCFGPNFADNVVDITKPFTISHSVEFSSPLVIERGLNVSQSVQNTTVEEIMEDALTKGEDQIITGEWEFTNELTFMDDVLGSGELKNFDINSLINNTNYEVRAAGDKIKSQRLQFKQECSRVQNVTSDIVYSPMKLDAFDKHQTIALHLQANKIVVVKSARKMTLLTSNGCMLTRYEWKKGTELFYRDASEHGKLNFGQIKDWQSTMHDRDGLLVFSTEYSTCSGLLEGLGVATEGLHVTVMNKLGAFSPVQTLYLGNVKTFRLISNKDGKHTAVFAIQNDTLDIFTWNSHNGKFLKIERKLDAIYEGLDVTVHQSGFAVLLSGPSEIAIWQFSWTHQHLTFLAKEQFLSSPNNNPIIFDNYGFLYALVLRKSSHVSTAQTFSTTQVFSLVGTHLIKLQQIPLSDTHHRMVINFSQKTFVGFLSKSYGLNIYKFQGLSGLQRLNENPIKIFNGEGMVSFDVKAWDFSTPRPFIAVLTSQTIEIYHSNVYGDALDYDALNMCRP